MKLGTQEDHMFVYVALFAFHLHYFFCFGNHIPRLCPVGDLISTVKTKESAIFLGTASKHV